MRVLGRRNRMKVGEKIEAFKFFLVCNPVAQSSDVVAKMDFTGRLNTRKNAHDRKIITRRLKRLSNAPYVQLHALYCQLLTSRDGAARPLASGSVLFSSFRSRRDDVGLPAASVRQPMVKRTTLSSTTLTLCGRLG